MSYLTINLPAAEGAVLLSEDNFKKWIYVSSKNDDPNKINLVGRWVLVRASQDPNLPGGDGGSTNIDFRPGNVIWPDADETVVDANGKSVKKVKHDIDFSMIVNLPE